jgi:hypothetical protein
MTTNGLHSSDPTAGYPTVVQGVVEAVNARGVRVNGEWASVSQFKPVALPEVGARVRMKVDAKRFIATLEVLEEGTSSHDVTRSTSSRDRQIARLSVLKSAAAFAATRADIKSSDVLRIADAWLAWLET